MAVTRIESLTPEQEALLPVVRQHWADKMRLPFNKEAAIRGMQEYYKFIGFPPAPVLCVRSPLEAAIAINMLRDDSPEREAENIRRAVEEGFEVEDVNMEIPESWAYEPFGYYVNVADYGWCSFADFFERIGLEHENAKDFHWFVELLDTGIWDTIQMDNVCVVCPMPSILRKDAEGRLHAEDGPALRWSDGFEMYFWKGVEVPAKVILEPEAITREDLLKEENAERRRAYFEIMGGKRFTEVMDIVVIDTKTKETTSYAINPKGELEPYTFTEKLELTRTREKDILVKDYIYMLHVTCPSSEREYYIPVKATNCAMEALRSTFPIENYAPDVET